MLIRTNASSSCHFVTRHNEHGPTGHPVSWRLSPLLLTALRGELHAGRGYARTKNCSTRLSVKCRLVETASLPTAEAHVLMQLPPQECLTAPSQ